jgi:hypothetical protein
MTGERFAIAQSTDTETPQPPEPTPQSPGNCSDIDTTATHTTTTVPGTDTTAAPAPTLQPPHTLLLPCKDLAITLQVGGAQGSLFGGVEPQPPPTPRRDLAADVLAAFNATVAGLRAWAGKPTHYDPVLMTVGRRKEIEGRIAGIDAAPAQKLMLCSRVFDVQVHQIKSHGPGAKTDGAKRDWTSMRTSTLFAEKNFTRWLDRWSDDGDHELWFQTRADHRSRGSSMPGQNERLAEAAERDNAERERMEAELQAHLAKTRGPNYVPPPPRVDEDEECTF